MELAPIKQAEIIEIFGGLPPKEYLSLDLTDTQVERWYEIKKKRDSDDRRGQKNGKQKKQQLNSKAIKGTHRSNH